ncbi:MAG: tetraacyldisaccharide 4'-kinase, partial [Desulfobacterales bacterium]|nr:tetraacyldisaccharide 4'-kinase [Desulfobacterales bacterium]
TGKTPFTMHIARLLDQMGYNVCILSRGYKGRAEKSGGMVSDGHRLLMNALQAGDEAFLMASRLPSIPIAVGRNRIKSGLQVLSNQDIDVFLLDDGFQHLKLFRDLDIVILDQSVPFGNGLLFPRGPLRESSKALSRADVIVLTDTFNQSKVASDQYPPLLNAILQTKPAFNAVYKPYISRIPDHIILKQPICDGHFSDDVTRLSHKSIVAFAGLANNDRFLTMLQGLSANVIQFFHFLDHHFYKYTDLQPIIKAADEVKADFIVTTEKDFVKLPHHLNWSSRLLVLGVETVIDKNQDELAALLDNKLRISN